MTQQVRVIKPFYVNTDTDAAELKANESPYIKNYRTDSHRNANNENNSGNGALSGSNQQVGTPGLANIELSGIVRPDGFNKIIGSFEMQSLNECYFMNYNSNGNHGVYMLDGNTMEAKTVIIDPTLNFSLEPQFAIPEHRVTMYVVYRDNNLEERIVLEKYLIFTDGKNWQRWINVNAAIKTDGFNPEKFPYWQVRAPRNDRAMYVDYAMRHPMMCPIVNLVPYNAARDSGKDNKLIGTSYQWAVVDVYTDGRRSALSPYSLPVTTQYNTCDRANLNVSRCVDIMLDAGGPMVEYKELYQRQCQTGAWRLYDTLTRFTNCGANDPNIIGTDYWLRQNPWADYSFDPLTNMIKYRWCGDRLASDVDQTALTQFHTGLPIKSVGLANLGDSIMFANNMYEYPNVSCEITDAMDIDVVPGEQGGGCDPNLVTITMYAYLGSDYQPDWRNQFVWSDGPWKDDGSVKTGMGLVEAHAETGLTGGGDHTEWKPEDADKFLLYLNNREGLVMYLAGTDYYAVGKQWYIPPNSSLSDRGTYVGPVNKQDTNAVNSAVDASKEGGIYYQRFDFKVPRGEYIARFTRHDVDLSGSYKDKSTYVVGIMDSKRRSSHYLNRFTYAKSYINFFTAKVNTKKEMKIHAYSDIDVWQNGADMFCIFLPFNWQKADKGTIGFTRTNRFGFNEGYLREDVTYKVPVPLFNYQNNHGGDEYKKGGYQTDHNGFFFAYSAAGDAADSRVAFTGRMNCGTNNNQPWFTSPAGTNYNPANVWNDKTMHRQCDTYISGSGTNLKYQSWGRVTITGKVVNCETGIGIGNVAVTLTDEATAITGTDGQFSMYAHPDANTEYRTGTLVYNGNQCTFSGCDCAEITSVEYDEHEARNSLGYRTLCQNGVERTFTAPDKLIQAPKSTVAHLKMGGRYGYGYKLHDLAGRCTYVQLKTYKDYPTIQEQGGTTAARTYWRIKPGTVFPKDAAYITWFRTENLNAKSYVQWVGDKIEFINAEGNVQENPIGATRARITIQSLLDFNIAENFSTTVGYQVQKGDILRIIDDGDGHLLKLDETNGFMDYLITGSNYTQSAQNIIDSASEGSDSAIPDPKWIYINYDSRLDQLQDKCMFWIEIRRPGQELSLNNFYEICGTYEIINGVLKDNITGGELVTWDTYDQKRHITNTVCPGKVQMHIYESSSVTDYWGENCDSRGRINVEDKKAIQLWYYDDTIRSNVFFNEGRLNGLGTFYSSNRKNFKGQMHGGIVAVSAQHKILMFIAENDWFLASFDMNYIRNSYQGIIANNLDNQIDDNFQKVGDNYGCRMEDTSSIVFWDRYAFWADTNNRSVIRSDYSKVQAISDIDNRGYFDSKFTEVLRYNSALPIGSYTQKLIEIIASVDPASKEYNLTFRKRNLDEQTKSDFVNLEREIRIDESETFVFSISYEKWVRWTTYIPEFYGRLRKARDGKLLLTFKEASIYAHNSCLAQVFNSFYGITDSPVVEVVCQDTDGKQLIFQSVSLGCTDVYWHADRILTNERYSYSYLPPAYFKKKEHVLYAELLCDMNSYPTEADNQQGRLMLFDGKRIFGSFMQMRLCVNDSDAVKYFEMDGIQVRTIESQRTGK